MRLSILAGLSTIAFGYLYQLSGPALWVAGAIGAAAWALSAVVGLLPGSGLLRDVVGGLVVGGLSEAAAFWFRRPVSVFAVPAIIALVPGYLIYQSMVAFLENHFFTGFRIGLTAALAAGGLSIGLAVATAVVRPLLRKRRRRRN